MLKKYRALRFVIGLFRVIAWVVLIVGVLGAIGVIVASALRSNYAQSLLRLTPHMPYRPGIVGGLLSALGMLLSTAFTFVCLWAGSDFVAMLVDIEQNTRETAHYLKGELEQAPPRPEPVRWEQVDPQA